jgi:hypothetical protein
MATGGQFYWPPAGIFVAAYGQFFMAANICRSGSVFGAALFRFEWCEKGNRFYQRRTAVAG